MLGLIIQACIISVSISIEGGGSGSVGKLSSRQFTEECRRDLISCYESKFTSDEKKSFKQWITTPANENKLSECLIALKTKI